ncbi:uncharacterized protein LOC114942546 [Nylanderia fulva]|uniref:uncharacterized protein LOC114942546 n=1 Tax=Nylanderia fulva TaxID=613905 RepID=UPI0010FADC7F|nr:uncharacterized protein LOC114942546 [Nylanderia fulva]XP_029173766.1 uncharacterized protein LOC114942546 [Nylanderia fulva]
MPQIMAETFARGLLDKIMVDVLDVIDRDTEDGKSWEQHEETDDAQPEFVHISQTQEHIHVNYSKAEEIELIAKIVRDLHDIPIGDSRYVLPPSLLALEKQVKCAVDGVSLTKEATDVAETRHTTQGQGDTHRIIHAILDHPPIDPAESAKPTWKEKEDKTVNEATSVTIGLLHQLIEELENKAVSVYSKTDASSTSKERIAIWEEKEEQLVRTIEGNVANEQEVTIETLRGSKSTGRPRNIELDEELRSHSTQYVASSSREVGLEEIQIEKRGSNSLSSLKPSRDEEQILPIDDVEKRKTLDESMKKKKRSLGSRLRKFLRAVFSRQKN